MSRSWNNQASSLISAGFQLYSDHSLKKRLRRFRNFRGNHKFISRAKGSERLLLVVAGHKPGLWPLVLPRIKNFTPSGWDVCLCCPGVNPAELEEFARKNDWSYLHTPSNQLALTQNLAISSHPGAQQIVKIDEDIF